MRGARTPVITKAQPAVRPSRATTCIAGADWLAVAARGVSSISTRDLRPLTSSLPARINTQKSIAQSLIPTQASSKGSAAVPKREVFGVYLLRRGESCFRSQMISDVHSTSDPRADDNMDPGLRSRLWDTAHKTRREVRRVSLVSVRLATVNRRRTQIKSTFVLVTDT